MQFEEGKLYKVNQVIYDHLGGFRFYLDGPEVDYLSSAEINREDIFLCVHAAAKRYFCGRLQPGFIFLCKEKLFFVENHESDFVEKIS